MFNGFNAIRKKKKYIIPKELVGTIEVGFFGSLFKPLTHSISFIIRNAARCIAAFGGITLYVVLSEAENLAHDDALEKTYHYHESLRKWSKRSSYLTIPLVLCGSTIAIGEKAGSAALAKLAIITGHIATGPCLFVGALSIITMRSFAKAAYCAYRWREASKYLNKHPDYHDKPTIQTEIKFFRQQTIENLLKGFGAAAATIVVLGLLLPVPISAPALAAMAFIATICMALERIEKHFHLIDRAISFFGKGDGDPPPLADSPNVLPPGSEIRPLLNTPRCSDDDLLNKNEDKKVEGGKSSLSTNDDFISSDEEEEPIIIAAPQL